MREHLYRGKRKDNGKWVEGYHIVGCEVADYIIPHHSRKNGKAYGGYEAMDGTFYVPEFFEVLPETVGEYTGLNDKNGKKIFEGDILRGEDYPYKHNEDYNYFAEVCWWDNCPAFGLYIYKNPKSKVAGISAGNTEDMEDWDSAKWEVIGNIHDNPELLEGK